VRSSLAAARLYSQLPKATVGPSTGPQGAQAASSTNPMTAAPTAPPEMAEPVRLDTNLPPPAEVVPPSETIVIPVPPKDAHPMAPALPVVNPELVEPAPSPVVTPPPRESLVIPPKHDTSTIVDSLTDKLPPAAELTAKLPTAPSAAELKAKLPSAAEVKAKLPTPPSAAELAAKIPEPAPVVESAPVIPPPPPPRGPWFPKTRRAFRTLVYLAIGGIGYTYYSDSSAAAHSVVVMPLIRALTDAEDSHRLAIQVLQWPLRPVDKGVDDPVLETDVSRRSALEASECQVAALIALLSVVSSSLVTNSLARSVLLPASTRTPRLLMVRPSHLVSSDLGADRSSSEPPPPASQAFSTSASATSRLAV